MSEPKVSIRTVTPATAARWLSISNIDNRHLRPSVVQFYASQMAEGIWLMNGDAVRFDEHGVLQDGQHRLAACVKSGHSFKTVIIEGLPDSVRATIDMGVKRTSADFLTHHQYQNATHLAAAARLSYLYEIGKPFTPDAVANQVLLDWIEKNADIVDHVPVGQRVYRALRWSGATWGASSFLFSRVDEDMAADFMERLETGADLQKGNPIMTLRDYVVKQREDKSRGSNPLPARYQLAYVIKAWNAHYHGKPLKIMRWTQLEGFPGIVGYPNQKQLAV